MPEPLTRGCPNTHRVRSMLSMFCIGLLVQGYALSARAADFFSPELGLELRLIRYHYKYHDAGLFTAALQVIKASDNNLLNSSELVPSKHSSQVVRENAKLIQIDGYLPIKAGDVLIFDNLITADPLGQNSIMFVAETNPEIISGKYLLPAGTTDSEENKRYLATLKVNTPQEFLKLVTGGTYLEFRVARPMIAGTKFHSSTAIEFEGQEQDGKEYKDIALIIPTPPDRKPNEGLRNTVFRVLNPFSRPPEEAKVSAADIESEKRASKEDVQRWGCKVDEPYLTVRANTTGFDIQHCRALIEHALKYYTEDEIRKFEEVCLAGQHVATCNWYFDQNSARRLNCVMGAGRVQDESWMWGCMNENRPVVASYKSQSKCFQGRDEALEWLTSIGCH